MLIFLANVICPLFSSPSDFVFYVIIIFKQRDISAALSGCDGAVRLKDLSLEEAEEWIGRQEKNSAGEKYREFLKRFSHRCLKEVIKGEGL